MNMDGGGWGVARCRKSVHMGPDVYDDISTGRFSSQALEAASSVPQADTIQLTQHSSSPFTNPSM